jgi:hypothetical protein
VLFLRIDSDSSMVFHGSISINRQFAEFPGSIIDSLISIKNSDLILIIDKSIPAL